MDNYQHYSVSVCGSKTFIVRVDKEHVRDLMEHLTTMYSRVQIRKITQPEVVTFLPIENEFIKDDNKGFYPKVKTRRFQ